MSNPNLVPLNLDCGRCGTGLEVKPDSQGRALVHEDEEIVCPYCGATNQMSVEEDLSDDVDVDDSGDSIGWASVSRWICKHGKDDETSCADCDAEDERNEASPTPEEKEKDR